MVNISNRQKKYIISPAVPDTTEKIKYNVYFNNLDNLIYSGLSYYVGDYEVSIEDIVEYIYSMEDFNAVTVYPGDIIVEFVFMDDNDSIISTSTVNVGIEKESVGLDSIPVTEGIIDFEGVLNNEYNNFGLAVYPVFYVKNIETGKIGKIDCSGNITSYSETNNDYNIATLSTDPTIKDPSSIDFTNVYIDNYFNLYFPYRAVSVYRIDTRLNPHVCYDDNVTESLSSIAWKCKPLFSISDTEGYESGSGFYSSLLKHPYHIRFEQSYLDNWWKVNIPASVRRGFEVIGYGYIMIYIYPEQNVDTGKNPFRVKYNVVGKIQDAASTEPYFNLLLVNSDFNGDINVPLKVCNGFLKGKTMNNVKKVSYSDRYNNIHNGSCSNFYEIECYVCDEWLNTTTCNDVSYEELMAAMQTARQTKLIGNASISGMKMSDNITILNCRVSDVEKIETFYRYSVSNKIPTLKITLEIYR